MRIGKYSSLELALTVLPCVIKAKIGLVLLKNNLDDKTKGVLSVLSDFRFMYYSALLLKRDLPDKEYEQPKFELSWDSDE